MSNSKNRILVWRLTANMSFYRILLKGIQKKNINDVLYFRDHFTKKQSYKLGEF